MQVVLTALFLAVLVFSCIAAIVAHYVVVSKREPVWDNVNDEEQALIYSNPPSETSSFSSIYTLVPDLDHSKDEVRIMRLLAGSPGSKLECCLQVQSLAPAAEAVSYEALSYVWADIPGKENLYVDGVHHEITANLASALAHVRYEHCDRLLWVDAICINQAHSVERGYQVRLMGTVYSRASGVLIWLGPETYDSAQALQDLETLSRDKHFKELDFYGHLDNDGRTWMSATAGRIDPLEHLLQRAYWSRIWVVQEIVRAKKATVICGYSSIAWEKCVKVRDNWSRHSRKCCNAECGLMDPRMRRVMNWINSSWRMYQDTHDDMLSRLNLTRKLDATDPRDKIFGVLGLVRDESAFLDPDYKSEYPVVFRDWTTKLISTTQGLEVLLHTNYTLRQKDVPSWVPDWTQYNQSVRFQAERLEYHQHICRSFSADGCSEVGNTFLTTGYFLRLAGFHLDTVAKVGDRLVYDRQDTLTDDQNQVGAIKKWGAVLDTWAQVAGSADSGHSGGGLLSDAYWRTLVSDHICELGTFLGDRTSSDDASRYMLWSSWFTDLVEQSDENKPAYYKDCLAKNRDLDRFDWTIMNMNYNRSLFSTKDGCIGMGPGDMEPNDSVVLLRGSRTPFIVRPSDLMSKTNAITYQVIGYAYVQGVMYGERCPLDEQWEEVWFS